jgi:hypothetical protein
VLTFSQAKFDVSGEICGFYTQTASLTLRLPSKFRLYHPRHTIIVYIASLLRYNDSQLYAPLDDRVRANEHTGGLLSSIRCRLTENHHAAGATQTVTAPCICLRLLSGLLMSAISITPLDCLVLGRIADSMVN